MEPRDGIRVRTRALYIKTGLTMPGANIAVGDAKCKHTVVCDNESVATIMVTMSVGNAEGGRLLATSGVRLPDAL